MKLFNDKIFLASFFATVAGLLGATGVVQVGAEEQSALVEGVSTVAMGIGGLTTVIRGLILRAKENE